MDLQDRLGRRYSGSYVVGHKNRRQRRHKNTMVKIKIETRAQICAAVETKSSVIRAQAAT